MDTLSQGTLRQLARPWKLLKVRLFSLSHVVYELYFVLLQTIFVSYFWDVSLVYKLHFMLLQIVPTFLANYHLLKLYLCSFLQSIILQTVSMIFFFHANYYLANCIYVPFSYKLSSCKLYLCSFSCSIRPYHMASSPMAYMWTWRSSF